MKSLAQSYKWYAIYTRSRFEKKICNALNKSGFETFLPLVNQKRTWSDRIKTVQVPLLPSYVFIKTKITEFSKIYYSPGFVRFVAQEGKPCEIKENEINLLKSLITNGYKVKQNNGFVVGEMVRIIRGPLRGWEGRINSKKGSTRIVFQFDCIQQAICVEVAARDVKKVEERNKIKILAAS